VFGESRGPLAARKMDREPTAFDVFDGVTHALDLQVSAAPFVHDPKQGAVPRAGRSKGATFGTLESGHGE
jgi:hypothetical protein